jgi:hypothetical protein
MPESYGEHRQSPNHGSLLGAVVAIAILVNSVFLA